MFNESRNSGFTFNANYNYLPCFISLGWLVIRADSLEDITVESKGEASDGGFIVLIGI